MEKECSYMPVKKPTFEEAMARLEAIVTRLEKGDAPLEEAMALFEEGTALMKQCSTALDKAEQKVAKLLPGLNGAAVEEPMEEMEP
jgi:exodeoxyribonuclease VII small subunit